MSPVPDGKDMPENNHPEEGSIQDEPLPHHVIGQIDSDSDNGEEEGEEFAYDGQEYVYAQLPQDPEGVSPEAESDSSDTPEEGGELPVEGGAVGHVTLSPVPQVPDLPPSEESDLLWNQPRASTSESLDQVHADQVRSAMAGFQLPPSNCPDWAKNLRDEDWKTQLMNRLHGNKQPEFKAKFDK